jgi:hypothetical protein
MGTKNNPGQFDCYANAEPDEPMFILLGRDKHASALVELWALMRAAEGEDPAKVEEAFACAEAMRQYCVDRNKVPVGSDHVATTAIAHMSAIINYFHATPTQQEKKS